MTYSQHAKAWGFSRGSAGHVSQEQVKRYILEQQGKDVFEYSVFGSPEQKIGDFTQAVGSAFKIRQAKIARWSI